MKCPYCKVPLSTSPRHVIQNIEPVQANILGHIFAGQLNITQVDIYKCSTCNKLCFRAHETVTILCLEEE